MVRDFINQPSLKEDVVKDFEAPALIIAMIAASIVLTIVFGSL